MILPSMSYEEIAEYYQKEYESICPKIENNSNRIGKYLWKNKKFPAVSNEVFVFKTKDHTAFNIRPYCLTKKDAKDGLAHYIVSTATDLMPGVFFTTTPLIYNKTQAIGDYFLVIRDHCIKRFHERLYGEEIHYQISKIPHVDIVLFELMNGAMLEEYPSDTYRNRMIITTQYGMFLCEKLRDAVNNQMGILIVKTFLSREQVSPNKQEFCENLDKNFLKAEKVVKALMGFNPANIKIEKA